MRENAGIQRFKKIIKQVIALQIIVILLLALAFLILKNVIAARSVLIGGLICIVPGIAFSYKALSRWGASKMRAVLGQFYLAEGLKVVLTIILFILTASMIKVHYFPLILGYMVAQLIFVIVPMIMTVIMK